MASFVAMIEAAVAELALVLQLDGEPIPSNGIGETELLRHGVMPRLVWVPIAGTARGPGRQGQVASANPRPLQERELNVDLHVWAESIGAIERLANHVIASLRNVHGTLVVVRSEDWTRGASSTTKAGGLLVVGLTFFVAWTYEPDFIATVTQTPTTGDFDLETTS